MTLWNHVYGYPEEDFFFLMLLGLHRSRYTLPG